MGGEKGGTDSGGCQEEEGEGVLQDETEAVGSMGQLQGLGKGAEACPSVSGHFLLGKNSE